VDHPGTVGCLLQDQYAVSSCLRLLRFVSGTF